MDGRSWAGVVGYALVLAMLFSRITPLVYKRGDKNLIKETVKKVKMLQNFTFEKMLRKEQKW